MIDPADLPNLNRPLRQPSWQELHGLARHIEQRLTDTPLERITQEVGETGYAALMRELMETTLDLRRSPVCGLPPRLYSLLLRRVYRQMRAEIAAKQA